MNLNQAHKKFATITLDGWVKGVWTLGVAKGSMEVYSRFITERTLGVVKRLFMMPEAIDPQYSVIRFPDGVRYLIAKESKDYRNNEVYGYTYLLQEVIADATIITFTKTASASGMGRDATEVVGPLLPCYFERFGATDSREVDAVAYSRTRLVFPRGTAVSVDDEIDIGGRRFSIRESDFELNMSRAFGVEK